MEKGEAGKRRGWRRQVEASSGNSSLYSIGKSDPLEFYAQMFKVSAGAREALV